MKRIKTPRSDPNPLTLEQLRLFLTAARTGNFSQAAEEAWLSQSAFSRQIQALEGALGVQLFDRVGRKIRLNDAGKTLEHRAAEILARVERLVDEVSPAGKGTKGTIRLGSYASYGLHLLPSWLASFSQRFEGIHVTLLLRSIQEMAALLRDESIDAAIMDAPEANQSGQAELKAHISYSDELWIAGPRGVDPDELPGPDSRWFGIIDPIKRRKLAQVGIVIDDPTQVPGVGVTLKFLEAGLGYGLLPNYMARGPWKAGRITRMNATITRRVAFVTLASRPLSPCVSRFLEFLVPRWQNEAKRQREEARELRERQACKRKKRKARA